MTAASARRSIGVFAFASVLFTGCSSRMVPANLLVAAHLKGGVHGGLQPVIGSTIQMFDATAGAQALISASVLTDGNGSFSITGLYTCPQASDQVYLVATGGNPGGGVNSSLVLMTALGNCGDLTAATNVNVNEVTTVATIYAYASYFDPTVSNGAGYITNADAPSYATFLRLVDPASGAALTTADPSSPNKLNSLANTVATCVNAVTSAGVTQPCVDLVTLAAPPYGTTVPQDDAVAIFLIATNPGYNPTSVFNDAAPNPPFQPMLMTAPADWTIQ